MSIDSLIFTPRLKALWSEVKPRLAGAGLAHDANHIVRVTNWLHTLAHAEGGDPELSVATGLIHDLIDVPKESPDRHLGGEKSAIAGREPLDHAGFSEQEVNQIVDAVATSSWSRGLRPNSLLGCLLQDADRLDAIGAIGIARNFACAQEMATRSGEGRFYDPQDPFAQGQRPLNDRRNAIDHWEVKLLRLASSMHTDTAKAEAARRHDFLLHFRDEFRRELESAAEVLAQC